jgi:hypothetical protein
VPVLLEEDQVKLYALRVAATCFSFYASSCASFHIPQADFSSASEYDISLREVTVPAQFKGKYGEERIGRADSVGMQRCVFENGVITISWIPTDLSLAFTLENKAADTLKVVWQTAAYVDVTGAREAVTHGGVAYEDFFYADRRHQPSVVAGKNSMSDWVLPMSRVIRAGGFLAGTGHVKPLFSEDPTCYIGKTVQVMLPLKTGETIIEYTFVFDINGVMTGE